MKPKAARVVVDDAGSAFEGEDDVVVLGVSAGVVDVIAEGGGGGAVLNGEAAAHAEVHDQDSGVGQRDDQVFGAAGDSLDRAALEAGGELVGKGEAQIRAALIDGDETLAG